MKALPFVHGLKNAGEMVTSVISEATGKFYNRKQISSHLQVLKHVTQDPQRASLGLSSSHPAWSIGLPSYFWDLSPCQRHSTPWRGSSNPGCESQSFMSLVQALPNLKIPLHSNEKLSIQSKVPRDSLALLSINQQIRIEALHQVHNCLSLDFYDDDFALEKFCTLFAAESQRLTRTLHIAFIEGRDVYSCVPSSKLGHFISSLLPDLKMLRITLSPCFQEANLDMVRVPPWGAQTKQFLPTLSSMRATVRITLRWLYECEYFEDKYMNTMGWRFIGEEELPRP